MTTAVARLRRIRDAAPAVLGPDGEWLASVIRTYFAGAQHGVTLDDAAGVSVPPGGEGWWRREARQRRDDALRRLAEELAPGGTLAEREAALRAELRRYARRWPRDRDKAECPSTYGGIDRLVFELFRESELLNAPVPLSKSQLRKILSSCDHDETATAKPPLFAARDVRQG